MRIRDEEGVIDHHLDMLQEEEYPPPLSVINMSPHHFQWKFGSSSRARGRESIDFLKKKITIPEGSESRRRVETIGS
ncbi:hypothetical protein Tco_0731568 [Tanacetum coccineum]